MPYNLQSCHYSLLLLDSSYSQLHSYIMHAYSYTLCMIIKNDSPVHSTCTLMYNAVANNGMGQIIQGAYDVKLKGANI